MRSLILSVIGLAVGLVVATVAYIGILTVLAPVFTDARNYGEAGDTWVGPVATISHLAIVIASTVWGAKGFPLRRQA